MDTNTPSAWITASAGMAVESRSVEQIGKIVIKDYADVMIFLAEEPWMKVATNLPDTLPDVLTTIRNNKLSIAITPQAKALVTATVGHMAITRSNQQASPERVLIGIGLPQAPHIRIRGAGDVFMAGVDQEGMSLKIQGSGNIQIQGSVKWLEVVIEGAGNVDAKNVAASSVDLNISGSGNIDAHADYVATAEISGTGNIIVHGKPVKRNQVAVSTGSIVFQED